MPLSSHTDTPFQTYAEETLDALLDKEGFLLMLGTAEGTVKLATSSEVAIGVLAKKNPGDIAVQVTSLGSGVIARGRAGGAIAKGAKVVWGTGGKLVAVSASAGTYKTLGIKVDQATNADNDFFEFLTEKETVVVS